MSNMIPPLVCDTPPPIDFDQPPDDDFSGFESHDSTFAQYEDDNSLPSTPKYTSPATVDNNISFDIPVPSDLNGSTLDIPAATTSISDNLKIPQKTIVETLSAVTTTTATTTATTTTTTTISTDNEKTINEPIGCDNANELNNFSIDDDADDDDDNDDDNNLRSPTNRTNEININLSSNLEDKTQISDDYEHNLHNEKSIELDLISNKKLIAESSDNSENEMDIAVATTVADKITCDDENNHVYGSIETSPVSTSQRPSVDYADIIPPPIDDYELNQRNDSPPSLELAPENISDNEECDININEVVNEDGTPFDEYQNGELNINAYDDSTSLPSLKLDSMRTTPALFKSEDDELSTEEPFQSNIHINVINDSEIDNGMVDESDIVSNETNAPIVRENDSFGDFSEFSNAPKYVPTPFVNNTGNEFAFEADFSQFSSFEEATLPIQNQENINAMEIVAKGAAAVTNDDDDDFGDFDVFETSTSHQNQGDSDISAFSNFKAISEVISTPQQVSLPTSAAPDNDDDDDFGDFSDFQNQPAAIPSSTSTNSISSLSNNSAIDVQFNTSNIHPILDQMFPPAVGAEPTDTEIADKTTENIKFINEITSILKDFENSKALDHQWLSSTGKSSLVKALGIDSRNILYGEKWNSSMPRFAANLGFTPLEPMKPTSPATSNQSNTINGQSSAATITAAGISSANNGADVSTEVPVLFDWKSSGLVNPLDGGQEVVQKTNPEDIQSTRTESDRKNSTEAIGANVISPKEPISSQLDVDIDESSLAPTPISASYAVPGSSGTLKETHIFTPSKTSILNGGQKETKAPANFTIEFEKSSAGIVINENVVKKEYHDVVYEPEFITPNKVDADDFTEFQSVEVPIPVAEESNSAINIPLHGQYILEPVKAPGSIVINWPEPGQVNNASDLDDFSSFKAITSIMEPAIENIVYSGASFDNIPTQLDSIKPKEPIVLKEYSKPVIGVSPSDYMFSTSISASAKYTNEDFDDEFTEFQSIPPPMQETTATKNARLPDVLVSAQNQPVLTSKFILPLPDVSQHIPTAHKPIVTNGALSSHQYNDNYGASLPPQQTFNPIPVMSSVPMVPLQTNECLIPEIKSTQISTSNEPKIAWPDPGIDADEMARLEALFPQPKTNSSSGSSTPRPSSGNLASSIAQSTKADSRTTPPSQTTDADDEWTDFVSVTQPQLPITNILSKNLQKQNNDDDWSDFVSSNGPTPSNQPWGASTGPNFTAWNAPSSTIFQSSAHQVSIPPPSLINSIDFATVMPNSSHSNGFNNSFNHVNTKASNKTNGKIPLRPLHNQSTPSIISLPDLGFVGPKTLSNMSRANYSKK